MTVLHVPTLISFLFWNSRQAATGGEEEVCPAKVQWKQKREENPPKPLCTALLFPCEGGRIAYYFEGERKKLGKKGKSLSSPPPHTLLLQRSFSSDIDVCRLSHFSLLATAVRSPVLQFRTDSADSPGAQKNLGNERSASPPSLSLDSLRIKRGANEKQFSILSPLTLLPLSWE